MTFRDLKPGAKFIFPGPLKEVASYYIKLREPGFWAGPSLIELHQDLPNAIAVGDGLPMSIPEDNEVVELI